MVIGMTPISPFGILGTMMAIIFHPEPHWKPAKPKVRYPLHRPQIIFFFNGRWFSLTFTFSRSQRFAWGIGLVLSYTCFMLVQFRDEIGPDVYK
jgi:hypothetical protein